MSIDIVIQTAVALFSGGGISWLVFFRRKLRLTGNNLSEEEFDSLSKVVKQSMVSLQELSSRISELEKEKMEIMEQMSALRKENEALNATIRRMVRNSNPKL